MGPAPAGDAGGRPADPLHLGFACAWWTPRRSTWSYIAPRLRMALDAHARVSDIEAQRPVIAKALLKLLYGPRRGVPWQYSPIERRLLDRKMTRGVRRIGPDAVLGIAEADTPTDRPTFLYQDANFAAVLDHEQQTSSQGLSHLLPVSASLARARAEEQLERCRSAAGVLSTSEWFARYLIDRASVPADRVRVIPFGINNVPVTSRPADRASSGRLLFIGVDFERKGGPQLVEAVRILRARGDRDLSLTIAGPKRWPLPGRAPEFVDFRGSVAAAEAAALYPEHDLFVMPSRFEAFGIVFAEALAAGLPCIARRAFAMPEIVAEGVTGSLVDSDDPGELADLIDRTLADPGLHRRVADAAPAIRRRYSWETVSAEIVASIEALLGGTDRRDADRG